MAGGRPTAYKPEYATQVYKLALLGLDDEEVASVFNVTVQTIYNWDKRHPEFLEARARGKSPADAKVAVSLYKRAKGYSHDAVKIMQHEGQPVYASYTEHFPPDTQAATWWLKNRQGEKWKDKVDIEHSGSVGFADRLAKARERQQQPNPDDEASS
jgi:transposase